ncbi:hypothetical protein TNCV_1863541 [Trichonephila clavipes]|nr:hypothetical protein TNCV_1863541 [Trichonephila clavipes]
MLGDTVYPQNPANGWKGGRTARLRNPQVEFMVYRSYRINAKENLTENSLIEESIVVDRFDRWRAKNIVPRAINGMRANGLEYLTFMV